MEEGGSFFLPRSEIIDDFFICYRNHPKRASVQVKTTLLVLSLSRISVSFGTTQLQHVTLIMTEKVFFINHRFYLTTTDYVREKKVFKISNIFTFASEMLGKQILKNCKLWLMSCWSSIDHLLLWGLNRFTCCISADMITM